MSEKYNFAIAARWPGKESLCTYNMFGEVHYGTKKEAESLLNQVKEKIKLDRNRYASQPKAEDFQIYVLELIKNEV